jgi:hypothetical protein
MTAVSSPASLETTWISVSDIPTFNSNAPTTHAPLCGVKDLNSREPLFPNKIPPQCNIETKIFLGTATPASRGQATVDFAWTQWRTPWCGPK